MVLLYTPDITPRITYISKFLFNTILGVPVSFSQNKTEYQNYSQPKINYSREELGGVTIFPHTLLFEQNIREIEIETGNFQNIPILFQDMCSPLPFDPFAAAFFMLTRYEEYGAHHTDHHGRSLVTESVAYKNKFLWIPVVDHWALILKQQILQKYPDYAFPERQYKFVPTIDVDIAFAYRYRNFFRTAGATIKSILNNDLEDNRRRFNTLFLKKTDPYDTFQMLETWHNQHQVNPVFFFLLGKYGPFDKNISRSRTNLHKLIRDIHQKNQIGIHPSYTSNHKTRYIRTEIKILSEIIQAPVEKSRQHFLMLRLPYTYQNLIKNGITQDYTMGYASKPGFRAGTCTPFPFYDLSEDKETNLTVYPFQVMDGTLNQYMKLSPLEAIEVINNLVDQVKKVKGTFISLWHNESLSEIREWHRWREVYQQMLSYASENSF